MTLDCWSPERRSQLLSMYFTDGHSFRAYWERISARQSGKHNRREQDRQGSCCHRTNSLVGRIRHTKPLENTKVIDPITTNQDMMKITKEWFEWIVRQGPERGNWSQRTKSQKTSEDQRGEQCQGPDRERSLYLAKPRKRLSVATA